MEPFLQAPTLNTAPEPEYADEARMFQGIPSMDWAAGDEEKQSRLRPDNMQLSRRTLSVGLARRLFAGLE